VTLLRKQSSSLLDLPTLLDVTWPHICSLSLARNNSLNPRQGKKLVHRWKNENLEENKEKLSVDAFGLETQGIQPCQSDLWIHAFWGDWRLKKRVSHPLSFSFSQ
jgi:hypothetical protein